eukprot:4943874-Amphidinium_carterae.1
MPIEETQSEVPCKHVLDTVARYVAAQPRNHIGCITAPTTLRWGCLAQLPLRAFLQVNLQGEGIACYPASHLHAMRKSFTVLATVALRSACWPKLTGEHLSKQQ